MSKMTLRSFISGELDPALHQRVDLAKYQTGLVTCLNFFMRAQGGLYSRPGTRFIGAVLDSTRRTRLIPFQFNTEQTYILEFGHLTMRVIKDGGYVLAGAGPAIYQIATPYTETDLFDTTENVYMLQFTQTADVMTITHRNYATRELSRLDHDNWTLAAISFASSVTPPQFIAEALRNISSVSIDSADDGMGGYTGTGHITITTTTPHEYINGSVVNIDDVGGTTELNGNAYRVAGISSGFLFNPFTFKLQDSISGSYIVGHGYGAYTGGGTVWRDKISATGEGAGSYDKTYRYVVTVTTEDGVESLPSNEVILTTKSLSQTAGIFLSWGAVAGAAYYTVYKDPANGTQVYGFIGESKSTGFHDFNVAPDTSRTPPEENQPISSANNYPAAVGYYQQRRIFANTLTNPQTVYATQVGVFNSMRSSTPARDDDALSYTINSRQVNEIRHIIDLEDLMLLTSGAEYRVTEGQDFVLTPSTIGARAQSYNGTSWVRPATVNDSIIFVQEKGSRMRDLNYSVESGKYTGNDLSVMSEHLFQGRTVVEMAYAPEPFGILWCVMSDGALCGMTYQKEHQVWGWHRHETDGFFESVAVIREGNRDAVYFIVRRTIGGVTKRYVERLEERITTSAADAYFVDCGLSYSGAAATVISGLSHLEGKTVVALADGIVVENLVVASGQITLPRAASTVHVGLPYTCRAKTMEIDDTGTTLQGRKKNISEVAVRFLNSRGGWVGPDEDHMIEIKPRFDSDGYNAITLKSFEQRVTINADWNDYGQIVIEQRAPLPMTITAITPEFDIGG